MWEHGLITALLASTTHSFIYFLRDLIKSLLKHIKPRMVKTHLNFDLIKNNPDIKYVVVGQLIFSYSQPDNFWTNYRKTL